MKINVQITEHVLAMEKIAEQCITTKYSCNSSQVISDFNMGNTEQSEISYYSFSYWDRLPTFSPC